MTQDLAFTSAVDQRNAIAKKEVSPVELTKLYLDRIEQLDPHLNSFITVTKTEALETAQKAEDSIMKGEPLGPLHGLPTAIKDSENTRGVPSTQGSLVFKDFVPTEDSVIVERIKKAGAIILGKTNMPENGDLGTTENRLGDHCRNPWNTDRTAGGSSGGSASAVAAGLCSLASGGDGGGSIRIPASFCGTYGIKPTLGRIPLYNGSKSPVTANHFTQLGPISRTVADSALMLQVLAGYDSRSPATIRQEPDDYLAATQKNIKGLKLAWSSDYGYAAVDPEVVSVCHSALSVFNDIVGAVAESDLELTDPFEPFWTLYTTVSYARSGRMLEDHANDLTWYGREVLENGAKVTGAEYAKALGKVDVIKSLFANQLEQYDLLLSPTMALPAFDVGQHPKEINGQAVHPFWGFLPFTFPINMIGYPAASIPCGFSSEGLPIGLHIVGKPGREDTVLAASAAFERARPWIQERPPIS
mgnify:FL=1